MAVRTAGYEQPGATAEAALDARLVAVGTWLFLAAQIFFFAAWWFAFFYLRALNENQSWRAAGAGPPSKGYGAVVLVLALATALTYFIGSRQLTAMAFLFRLLMPVALILGIATCLFQGYAMWHLGFGLTDGGYPSVFAGLTGSWVVQFALATAWLASIVLQTGPAGDTILRRRPAASFAWVLLFLAAIGVVNYILLYLVA